MPHKQLFLIAVFEATLPFLLVSWGQQYIDSAVAAILMATIPLFAVFVNFIQQKRIRLRPIISVVIGFLGVMILLLPKANMTDLFHHTVAALAILAGACCFAVSLFLVKKLPSCSKMACARAILCWASLQLLPLLWFFPITVMPQVVITAKSVLSVLILGAICTGIVYVCYIDLVKRAGVVFTSLANYLVPLIGVFFGVVLLKEPLQLQNMLALALVLCALFLGLPSRRDNKSVVN